MMQEKRFISVPFGDTISDETFQKLCDGDGWADATVATVARIVAYREGYNNVEDMLCSFFPEHGGTCVIVQMNDEPDIVRARFEGMITTGSEGT